MTDPVVTRASVAPPQQIAPALFRVGHDFDHHPTPHRAVRTRLWAHASADKGTPRPLIIYLHGNNGNGYLQQLHPQLFGPPTEKVKGKDMGAGGAMHVGEILTPLIEQGQVTPLVVASPTLIANGKHMWVKGDIDLSILVTEVRAELSALAALDPSDPDHAKVEIDPAQVVVCGHSGAGGNPHKGLGLIADGGGQFTLEEKIYPLKLLGIMDTAVTRDLGNQIREGFAAVSNDKTGVYALFRSGTGGWGANDYDPPGLWEAMTGLARKSSPVFAGDPAIEEPDLVGSPSYGDPSVRPQRISIVLDQRQEAAIQNYSKRWSALPAGALDAKGKRLDWTRALAYRPYTGFGHHFDCVGIWTEWVARRYFPS